jgi:type I restriction enzyme S subunit
VHFRFPGYENAEFEDGLPKGWERVSFSNCAEYINGFAFKPDHHSTVGIPIIKIKELKSGVAKDTPRNSGIDIPEKYKFNNGAILFSWSADLDVYWWAKAKHC